MTRKRFQVATVLIWEVEADDPDSAFKTAIADGPDAKSPKDIKSYVNEIDENGKPIQSSEILQTAEKAIEEKKEKSE